MIYGYHLNFKDEKVLQSIAHENVRSVIPVIENKHLNLSSLFPVSSPWMPASGVDIRYLSPFPFSKENHDFSWGMEIKDVLSLHWSKESNEIIYVKGKAYRPDRLRFWLYHTFFPIVLELQGIYHILHVGAVEIEGKPVLFSAPSFGGKSTMTDYFIQQGHTMLCDDALGIEKVDSTYHTIASYPFHRPYREPEDLGYPVSNFASESKALSAVYILNKSQNIEGISIRELKGIEKFKAFHYSAFVMFNFLKEERFSFFTELSKKIPMYEITYPHDIKRLPEVYDEIIKNATFSELSAHFPATTSKHTI